MAILIGKNYKLETMRLNIVLFGKPEVITEDRMQVLKAMFKARKGMSEDDELEFKNKEWIVEGYFSNIQNALTHLINLEVEKSDLKDVQTVVEVVNKALGEIKDALSLLSKKAVDESLGKGDTSG